MSKEVEEKETAQEKTDQEKNNKKKGSKKNIVVAIIILLLLLLILLLWSCNSGKKGKGDGDSTGDTNSSENSGNIASDSDASVIEITVDNVTVKENESSVINVVVTVDSKKISNDDVKITYSIDDESIATVDENGKITGKKPGTTTLHITVTTPDGKVVTKDVEVVIVEEEAVVETPTNQAPATTETPTNQAPAATETPTNQAPATTETPTTQAPATTETPTTQATTEAPKHTHNYVKKETTRATCTTAGVNTFICSCGDSYTESVPKLEHSYSESGRTEATCTVAGSVTYKCSRCNDTYGDTIAATGHNWSVWNIGNQSDKYSESTRSCLNGCGTTESHKHSKFVKNQTCDLCGYVYTPTY